MDVVTGSNCCSTNWFHWFEVTDDGMLSKRYDGEFSIDSKLRIAGKSESRPYLLDWNRDGKDDLVLVLLQNFTDYDSDIEERQYDYRYGIFTHTDADARKDPIDTGETANSELAPKSQTGMAVDVSYDGPDLELALTAFDLGADEFNSKLSEQRPIKIHFGFADFDGDGNFDILYSEAEYERKLEYNESGSYRTYQKTGSAIYWKRNLTSKGEPRFGPAKKLYDFPEDWIVHSFCVGDIDQDDVPEIVASVFTGSTKKTLTELWLLKTQ